MPRYTEATETDEKHTSLVIVLFYFCNCVLLQVIPTKDRVEALMAFREKRKPLFRGE